MLYIVRGLPGSGKSTFAKQLQNHLQPRTVLHVEADQYWIRPDGFYDFNYNRLGHAHEWCKQKVLDGLSNIIKCDDVIVSNTFTTEDSIKPYIEMSLIDKCIPYVIIRCDGEWQNIHNVPEATLQNMKNRMVDIEGEIYAEDYKRICGVK